MQINNSFELQCELTDRIWSSGVGLSRVTDGSGEMSLCTIDNNGTGSCTEQGFFANGTAIDLYTMLITLYNANATCNDKGEYFCSVDDSSGSKTSISVFVFSKYLFIFLVLIFSVSVVRHR